MSCKRTYLVSGPTGFLGLRLVQHLLGEGHRVYAITRNALELGPKTSVAGELISLRADSVWQEQLNGVRFDAIYHLAAQGGMSHDASDIGGMVDANLTLGLKMLECARAHPVNARPAFVHCLSFWQFRSGSALFAPNSLYAASKQAFTDLVEHYRQNEAIPAVGLVLFDTYGSGDQRGKLVSALVAHCRLVHMGGDPAPFALTSGKQEAAFTHVDDIVKGFETARRLLDQRVPESAYYCLRSSQVTRLRDLIDAAIGACGLPGGVVHWGALAYRRGEIMSLLKGPLLPGWEPQIGFSEGFTKMVTSDA
jgi:nucleoside-diphosphate-sugar epimerase